MANYTHKDIASSQRFPIPDKYAKTDVTNALSIASSGNINLGSYVRFHRISVQLVWDNFDGSTITFQLQQKNADGVLFFDDITSASATGTTTSGQATIELPSYCGDVLNLKWTPTGATAGTVVLYITAKM